MLLVTGGAGFIGSNFVLDWLAQSDEPIVNLDKLTYAGNLENLSSLGGDKRHEFVKGDIGDSALVASGRLTAARLVVFPVAFCITNILRLRAFVPSAQEENYCLALAPEIDAIPRPPVDA